MCTILLRVCLCNMVPALIQPALWSEMHRRPALKYTLEWAVLTSRLRLWNVYYITVWNQVHRTACPQESSHQSSCLMCPLAPRAQECLPLRVCTVRKEMLNKCWTNLWNKGLTSADCNNKATLLLPVPCSHSSCQQRIHPHIYWITICRITHEAFPLQESNLLDLVHKQSSIATQLTHVGHTSSFLAWILA